MVALRVQRFNSNNKGIKENDKVNGEGLEEGLRRMEAEAKYATSCRDLLFVKLSEKNEWALLLRTQR